MKSTPNLKTTTNKSLKQISLTKEIFLVFVFLEVYNFCAIAKYFKQIHLSKFIKSKSKISGESRCKLLPLRKRRILNPPY
ncbi:hypothetical protein DRO51_01545 [Candidatus Bathyarchaeota archaeon]|nr:MAG: hypothetical protein DRO51_01545 [Candidatus Bathyarchaeota archaeon]